MSIKIKVDLPDDFSSKRVEFLEEGFYLTTDNEVYQLVKPDGIPMLKKLIGYEFIDYPYNVVVKRIPSGSTISFKVP